MLVAFNAVNDWLGSVISTITNLQIPDGLGNYFPYLVIILLMFLIRLGFKAFDLFIIRGNSTKNFSKNGKDK